MEYVLALEPLAKKDYISEMRKTYKRLHSLNRAEYYKLNIHVWQLVLICMSTVSVVERDFVK